MNRINKKNIMIPILLLVVLSISILAYKTSSNTMPDIPYKSFVSDVAAGKVSEVFLTSDETMKVRLKNKLQYHTENPRSLQLKEDLLLKGIQVHEGESSGIMDVLPVYAFFLLLAAAMFYIVARHRSGNGSGTFKLSSINVSPEAETGITFDEIAGNAELKESIKELVDFIKVPEKYLRYDAKMPRGVILYGPPGTGKTLMAKALASEAGVPFYAVNGSDFVQIYVGIGAGRIRDLFKKAREKGKAVIFIDEIDAIGKKRDGRADGGSDERDQTLNALLAEMSGFNENDGIIVMAATNRLDVLDDALLRPGRFDRHLEVGLPDVNARFEILKLHARNKPLANDVDLFKVAQMTVYFSGAKLEHLMNESAILAAQADAKCIDMQAIDKAYGIVLAGAEKKDRSFITDNDSRITAFHEAGHALVSKLVSPENIVSKVTIIPSTKGAGGYTLNIPPDRMYRTRKQLLEEIKIALGGRAAEELVFGRDNITTGAYSDIQQATRIMLAMVKSYGMFEDTGLVSYEILDGQGMTNSTDLIKLCNNTISGLYNEVTSLLAANLGLLERITERLLIQETIYEDELDQLVVRQ